MLTDQTIPIGSDFCVPAVAPNEKSTHFSKPQSVPIWGTEFSKLTMDSAIKLADDIVQHRQPQFMVTANLNYLMLTEQHPRLREVNRRAAAVLADGNPIVARSRLNRRENQLPCRVAGADMIERIAELAATRGYRVFFLGGEEGVAQAASGHLKYKLPKLQIAGCYSPPFRPLSAAEQQDMLTHIQEADADILLVAFGQPKGELWILDHYEGLKVPLSIQLGASFDFLAGTAQRAPDAWQRVGCEWLYRAATNPTRLVPRYAQNALFLFKSILRELCGKNRTQD